MARVWVYVWDHVRSGNGASWGHAAMLVEQGPYISWWPQAQGRDYLVDQDKNPTLAKLLGKIIGTTNVYKVRHRAANNYQQDCTTENRPADTVVLIADGVLDTVAIERWWRGYEYETASFHVIKKNCSTTVIRALRAGGSDKHLSVRKLGLRHGRVFGPDFLSKQTGWEPTDILAYLRLMNRSLGDEKVNMNGAGVTPPRRNTMVEGTGVAMCEEHGFPLLTCPNC
jgi:hypothetical protein